MKPYILTTAILFSLIALAHVARLINEWPPSFDTAWFIAQTLALLALAVALWGFVLFFRKPRP